MGCPSDARDPDLEPVGWPALIFLATAFFNLGVICTLAVQLLMGGH